MKENFDKVMGYILQSEGGFVNDPRDPGGITNHGVTKKVWDDYVGRETTEQEMRDLTEDDVKPLYKKNYWNVVGGDSLPDGVDYAVMDYAVNSGTSRAIRALQTALGLDADGVIGPLTLKSASEANAKDLAEKICEERLAFMKQAKNPKTGSLLWDVYGKGWGNRVELVQTRCNEMTA